MADKTIQIILKAKNAMASGLNSAGKSLTGFAKSAWNVAKMVTGALLGIGTTVAGLATTALKAWSGQENANVAMATALRSNGEAVDRILPKMQALASAIQDETGAADENTLSSMARMRMLGVQTEQMEKAAKGVIALGAAGMEQAAAEKAVAQGLQGSYTMLSRYVPAIKLAATEEEKAAIFNKLLADGYDQQKAKLGTLSGQYEMFKTRMGDLWEEVGRGIASNGTLFDVLSRVNEKIKEWTGALSDWINAGGVADYIADFQGGLEIIRYGFVSAGNSIEVFIAKMRESSGVFDYVATLIARWGGLAKAAFDLVADYAVYMWNRIRFGAQDWIKPPDTGAYLWHLRRMGEAIIGQTKKETGLLREAQKEQERDALLHQVRMAKIEENRLANYRRLAEQRADVAQKTNAIILSDDEKTADETVEAAQKAADKIEDIYERRADKVERANDGLLPDEMSTVNGIVAVNEAGADKVVDAWERARASQSAAAGQSSGYASISDFMNRPSIFESMTTISNWMSKKGATAKSAAITVSAEDNATSPVQLSMLDELRQLRRDNQKLLRMG